MNIEDIVCDYYHMPVSEVFLPTRKREIVTKRQTIHYFYKRYTKLSLASIGSGYGGKDHATVMNSCKIISNLIDTDIRFRKEIDELHEKIKAHIDFNLLEFNPGNIAYYTINNKVVKVVLVVYSNHIWKCYNKSKNIYYSVHESDLTLVNPNNKYDCLLINSVDELKFNLKFTLKDYYSVIVKWDINSIAKIKEKLDSMHIPIKEPNFIIVDSPSRTENYLLATNNPVPKRIISNSDEFQIDQCIADSIKPTRTGVVGRTRDEIIGWDLVRFKDGELIVSNTLWP